MDREIACSTLRSALHTLRLGLATLAAVASLAAPAAAQTIASVTPAQVTIGTVVTITGTGFGAVRPKLYLTRADTTRRVRLVPVAVSDTEVQAVVRTAKAPAQAALAGAFDLNMRVAGGATVVAPASVELKLPDNIAFDRSLVGRGELVVMTADYLGARKGRVLVAGLAAQVVEWNAIDELPGTVVFRIPFTAPSGRRDVEIVHPLGRVVLRDSITVDGADDGGGSSPDLRVVSAGSTGNTEVLVQFNQPVLGGANDAENPAHYRITSEPDTTTGTPGSTLYILDAELVNDESTVRLTTLSQSDVRYKLTVTSVRDIYGRPIAPPEPFGVDPSSTTFVGTGAGAGEPADSDGDGLGDAVEQRGWTIAIRRTNGTYAARSVTSDPGDPRESVLSLRNVAARDTDADGIGDADELHYGIDPRTVDSDGDTLSDYRELNWIYADPANQDSDSDSLDDGLEYGFFKSSPIILDTDGDQLGDADELLVRNRDPRSADLPRHAISIGDVFVSLNVEYSFVTTRDLSAFENKDASVTLEQNTSTEITNTDTATTEWFAKAGVSTSAGANFPDGLSADVTFTAEAGIGASGTYVQTNESKQASSSVQQDTRTSGASLTTGESETRTVTGARLVVPVSIENVSDVAFTMSNVEITALIPNPSRPTSLIPIATLLPEEGTATTYNFGTIDSRRGPFRFVSSEQSINPDLIDALLAEPKAVLFKVSNFNLVDEFGRNFSFQQQDVTERTAPVVIDYGNGEVERHWVALGTGRITAFDGGSDPDNNGDGSVDELDRIVFDPSGKPVGVDLVQALEEVLGLTGIDLDTDSDATDPEAIESSFAYETLSITPVGGGTAVDVRSIVRIRGVKADSDENEAWVLLTRQGYDAMRPFDEVVLRRSEGVTFALVVDRDGDGVTERIEILYGTSDDETDSDFDGRGDFEEIYESYAVEVVGELPRDVFSNPAAADQDGDGLDDSDEEDLGTDPRLADTDGDGACDGGGLPACAEDESPLDPTVATGTGVVAEYLFTAGSLANTGTGAGLTAVLESDDCTGLEPDRFDEENNAYGFNRSTDFYPGCDVSGVGRIVTPHIELGGSYTISAWVRFESGNDAWIVGRSDGTSLPAGSVRLQRGVTRQPTSSGSFVNIGTVSKVSVVVPGPNGTGNLVAIDPITPANNTWYHYAAVIELGAASTRATLYRNGVAVAQTVVGVVYGTPPSTDRFFIAGRAGQMNEVLAGRVDDVRIHDGALGAADIAAIVSDGGYVP